MIGRRGVFQLTGKFITFEGPEGSGKTSVIKGIKQYFDDNKIGYIMDINAWAPTLIYRNVFLQFKDLNEYFINKAQENKALKTKPTSNWNCDTYNTQGLYDFLKDKTPNKPLSI